MFIRLIFLSLAFAMNVNAVVLTLDEYLNQVQNSDAFVSSKINEEAFNKQKQEATAVYIPNFYITGSLEDDKSPNSTFTFLSNTQKTLQTGVNFLTPIGLSGNAYFQTSQYNAVFVNNLFQGGVAEERFSADTYAISISQELWKNGFGKTTRSTEKMVVAQKLSSVFQSAFQNKQNIYNAILAFYNVSANMEMIKIIDEGMNDAYDILKYTKQRYEMGVFERADVLKFEFMAQQLEFTKKQTIANLELAIITFNASRGMASNEIKEQIAFVQLDYIKSLTLPEMDFEREDIKSLQKQMEVTKENFNISLDNYTPAVTLSAGISSNGLDPSANTSITEARKGKFINKGVSVNINIPIGTVRTLNDGYRMAQIAAKKSYEASVVNAKSAILNIQKDFEDLRSLILMQEEILKTAKEKFYEERKRYKNGRTTSLQLYTEEQDYINAGINLVSLKIQLLQIYALSLTYAKTK